jgi:hypothetical protein
MRLEGLTLPLAPFLRDFRRIPFILWPNESIVIIYTGYRCWCRWDAFSPGTDFAA